MHHAGFLCDEGIEADIHLIESIDEVSDRLSSHDLDLALSVTENVILERESGGDLVVIGGNVNRLPFSFIARPGITSYADLRGKRIGVSSKAAGSSSLIMRILDGHGLTYPDDYTLIDCGPILTRWEMLQSGEIDAGLQGAPLNHVALDACYVDLGNPRGAFPDFQFTSLNASRAWIAANGERLHRALRAFIRAHDWFYADKAATIPVAQEETGIGADYAARAWDEYVRDEIFPRGRHREHGGGPDPHRRQRTHSRPADAQGDERRRLHRPFPSRGGARELALDGRRVRAGTDNNVGGNDDPPEDRRRCGNARGHDRNACPWPRRGTWRPRIRRTTSTRRTPSSSRTT